MLPFQWFSSVSNIHPMFVHFPIALLVFAGVMFMAGYYFHNMEFMIVGKWNLLLGAVSAVVTVMTGLLAEGSLPHNEEIHAVLEIHETIMISVAILASALSFYLFRQKKIDEIKRSGIFFACLVFLMLLLTVGADYGGMMVYRYGAGTELFKELNPTNSHQHGSNSSGGDAGMHSDDH